MDTQGILALFFAALVLTVASFWLHGRLAGPVGKPGCLSMSAFVLGWIWALTALLTGGFLLSLLHH